MNPDKISHDGPKPLALKQEEAEERRSAHLVRSVDEQMALIRRRPGNSVKERERLIARKEAEMNAKPKKAKKVKA